MKKNTFITSLALGLSCLLLHFSCGKKEVCRFLVQDAAFTFRLVDQYGVNQIAKWGSRYLSDSVYVTKIDGTLPNQLSISPGGSISFFIPDSYNEALDSQVMRQFLLYLPDIQGHPKDDIDTITFKYRFQKTEDFICYERLQVIFNDSIYHDGQYTNFIILTKN
ncbi:MAG: hypothetical protein EPGJADBJ_00851 [Saprospiraceae bacterium]|nr:hypothetical protein [Saprospiraceae bacterium]MBV6439212.1 hypothetical protein [Saprospiraceae bacterium]